jgi:plasmid stabilization system protein ParE
MAIPPYILRYQVTPEAVVIVRIRHGAQQDD